MVYTSLQIYVFSKIMRKHLFNNCYLGLGENKSLTIQANRMKQANFHLGIFESSILKMI